MKRVLHLIGAILVSFVAAYYLFILIVGLSEGPITIEGFESIGMIIFGFLNIVCAVMNWMKLRYSPIATLVVGVLFSIFAIFTAGHSHFIAVLVSGGPLILGGAFLLLGVEKEPG